MGEILRTDACEIGTHCHAWNTPPFEEATNEKNRMLSNLSEDLQHAKISVLHDTVVRNFGIKPVSFRSGKWSYNQGVAKSLYTLGYKVDTSIIPYTDWACYNGPDFSTISPQPFWLSWENLFEESSKARDALLEIPPTVGFLQKNFSLCDSIFRVLSRKPLNRLRLIGLLDRLYLLNKVGLSPEISDSQSMIKLARCLLKKGYKLMNMFFHSSSLKAGLNEFVITKSDQKQFIHRIKEFLMFTRDTGIESIKLSESLDQFS